MHVNQCTKTWISFLWKSASFSGLVLLSLTILPVAASGQTHTQHPFCQAIASGKIQASSGAQMWCFGPQRNGPSLPSYRLWRVPPVGSGFTGTNVDAANLSEDITPSGTRGDGQSEVSIAASGQYVVEQWNDSTGLIAPCLSPDYKEELSGFGFSSNGGKTFTDLGGLPNNNCTTFKYEGDPGVEVYQVGGKTYFYLSSIYASVTGANVNNIAITACQVIPGSPASLSCGQPIIAGTSSECFKVMGACAFYSFLDKDFLSIDAAHGRLYVSYTEFGFVTHPDDIEIANCDIGNSLGGPGPLGGTPAAPVCENGSQANPMTPPPPYLVVAPADTVNFCEREGAYPAADPATGDVYVAHEYNWATGHFGACESIPHEEEVAYVPSSCLTLPTASCSGPAATTSIPVISTDFTIIPGYSRGIGNDFPRIAVSKRYGTVSVVWNDTRSNPQGDILLQSLDLVSLNPVQSAPVKLNNDTEIGTLHFLPALRNVDAQGNLNISWYDHKLVRPPAQSELRLHRRVRSARGQSKDNKHTGV